MGAAIAVRQNRYISAFTAAEATSPQRASSLEQLGQRDSWIFRRLVAAGVFVRAGATEFWLDERAAAEFMERRRRFALETVGALLLIFALVMYWMNR
ncbi:MAG: hypothetical protein DCC67_20300 [Planctomycetota bacterium]|nr:MAG: hypothetical protein DCC67_20300 [Planctomycetota bacterium]